MNPTCGIRPAGVDVSRRAAWLLVVDDDRDFCDSLARYFTNRDYAVRTVYAGANGFAATLAGPWRAIILGAIFPGIDGLEAIRNIRRTSDAPVLVVAANVDDAGAVTVLEAGADACLAKGSSHRQILARLQAICRRTAQTAPGPEEITVAELRIAPASRKATLAGQNLALTPGEFDILLSLARAKGRVKTRDGLSTEVRSREYGALDRALDVQVSCLRRKLGDDPRHPRFIRTVRASGYMLVDPGAC